MTLEKETGGASQTSNSYVTVAEADDYFSRHLQGATWATKTTAEKETLLITAARAIDHGADWKGRQVEWNQAMQWPRAEIDTGMPWPDTLYPDNTIPPVVQKAQMEVAALFMTGGDRFADQDSDGIASVSLGKGAVAVTFDKSTAKTILGRIAPLLISQFAINTGTKRGSARTMRV